MSLQPSGRGPVHKGTLTAPVSAVLAVPAPAPWLLISITFPSIQRENTGSPAAQHSHLGALCEHTPSSGADCCLKAPQVIPIRSWLLLGPTARFCREEVPQGAAQPMLASACAPTPRGRERRRQPRGTRGPPQCAERAPPGCPVRPASPLGAPGRPWPVLNACERSRDPKLTPPPCSRDLTQ